MEELALLETLNKYCSKLNECAIRIQNMEFEENSKNYIIYLEKILDGAYIPLMKKEKKNPLKKYVFLNDPEIKIRSKSTQAIISLSDEFIVLRQKKNQDLSLFDSIFAPDETNGIINEGIIIAEKNNLDMSFLDPYTFPFPEGGVVLKGLNSIHSYLKTWAFNYHDGFVDKTLSDVLANIGMESFRTRKN